MLFCTNIVYSFAMWEAYQKLIKQLYIDVSSLATSLKWLVTCHEHSWYVMTGHDKTWGFIMKNTQISSNVTKDIHMSWNVTMFFETFLMTFGDLNMMIFDDIWLAGFHFIILHFHQLEILSSQCHQLSWSLITKNHQKCLKKHGAF